MCLPGPFSKELLQQTFDMSVCDMFDGHKWSHFQICDRGQKCLMSDLLGFLERNEKSVTKKENRLLCVDSIVSV